MKRRQVINNIAAAATGVALHSCSTSQEVLTGEPKMKPTPDKVEVAAPINLSGAVNHSVCKWCYNNIPLEEFADRCKDMGLSSIELLDPKDWDVVLKRGMQVAISNGSPLGITRGWNDVSLHKQLRDDLRAIIPQAAEKGIPQIIVFSGNRGSISDKDGLEACAVGLAPIVRMAEREGVQIIMELLNSKLNHPDYMCDHTDWGVKLVEKIGSPAFKLLYDIYHMQIMEGDIIKTIQLNSKYIGHYHTGGVPGRNEIDETQELYYPAIIKAIIETGFGGFVAQEFIPAREDALASLKQGVDICDVVL